MCKPAEPACTPACAGGRTIAALAGCGLAFLAATSIARSASEILLVIEDIGAIICALLVITLVALVWRAGMVARVAAPALRVTVWTCTQTRALSSAGVRGCARVGARRRLAARDVKALPMARQGPGVGIGARGVVGLSSAWAVPRSAVPTTGPTTHPTTGSDDRSIRVTTGPYQLGEPDRIVVVVDEAERLLGDLTPWQRQVLAHLMMMGRKD